METKVNKKTLINEIKTKSYKIQQLIGVDYWFDYKQYPVEELENLIKDSLTCYTKDDEYIYFSVSELSLVYPLFRLKLED